MRTLLMTTIGVLIVFNLLSQTEPVQTVKGIVLDKQTQLPLPGATVIILNSNPLKGSSTNQYGEFRIESVPVGRVSVEARYIGYDPLSQNNQILTSGKELILTFELEEKVTVEKEILITSKTDKTDANNKMASASVRSFTIEETNKYAGSLGDPSRMVSNFAGVSIASDSRNDIIIRGNSPIGLLWRLDGIDIPNPNHFGALGTTGGPVSILNNNLLTNSDFFTGAFPSEYGNALSGAFDLKMRTGNKEKREYVGQIGMNGFEFGAEGPFNKKHRSSYLINYRYSTPAVFSKMGIAYSAGSSVPYYQDLSFKVDFPKEKSRLSLIGIGGKSNIKLYDSEKDTNEFSFGLNGTNTDFGSQMGVFALIHNHYFNQKTRFKNSFSLTFSRSLTYIDSIPKNDTDDFKPFYRNNFHETKGSYSTSISSKIDKKNNIVTGISFDLYKIHYFDSVYFADINGFYVRDNENGYLPMIQAFFQWQHKFSDKALINAGIHDQHLLRNNTGSIEPRFGFKWKYKPGKSLNLAAGLHSQIQPKMIYFARTRLDDGTYITTNENLKMSKSIHAVLGNDYNVTEYLRIKAEAYYQYLFNIPVSPSYTTFSMLNEGAYFSISSVDSLLNKGTGYNYGIELTIEKFLDKNYYYLITTSIFDSKYKGYDNILRNTVFNGNYVINALAGYEIKLPKKNSVGFDFRFVYAGGKRFVPIDKNESLLQKKTVYLWESSYEKKYDPYFKLDFKISLRKNGKKTSQDWAIDLMNITNHQNIFSEGYDPQTNSIHTDYQSGFMPMFLYRIQF